MEMLTNPTVLIILQCIHVLDQGIVHPRDPHHTEQVA